MGKTKLLRNIRTLCALALAVFFMQYPVLAQERGDQLSLTTSPLPISLRAKPGESVSTDITVKNSGNQTEELQVGLMKFSASDEDGTPKLEDRGPEDDYFDWVTFSESIFSVESKQDHTIKMTIDLPETAALGYYYGVTFTRANLPDSSGGNNKVRGGTAVLVLLEAQVDGARRELDIAEFKTTKKAYEFLPVAFTVQLENKGNIHISPHGNIFIKRGGSTIATLAVNQGSGNILPGTKRTFVSQWDDGFPHYEVKQENNQAVINNKSQQEYRLVWESKELGKLRIGRYTAVLNVIYDDNGRDTLLEATVTFWVIPWRIIGMLLIPLAIIGLLAYAYLRTRRRLKRLEAGEAAKPKSKPKPKDKK